MTQSRPHADKVGSYQIMAVLNEAVVDPGRTLSGSIFFSGYGRIENAKLVFAGPKSLGSGTWKSGFGRTPAGVVQGIVEQPAAPEVAIAVTAAVRDEHSNVLLTPFSDANGTDSTIWSEMRSPEPPLSFSYDIPSRYPPGSYKILAVFTYFNGECWVANRLEVPYSVTSIFQRYESHVATVAVIAAAATVIASIATVISTVWTLFGSS